MCDHQANACLTDSKTRVNCRSLELQRQGSIMGTTKGSIVCPPLLEVSLDAATEECVVKEITEGLVELDWCTMIGVKPGTRRMGTSSHL